MKEPEAEEPETDLEFEAALKRLDYEVYEDSDGSFCLMSEKGMKKLGSDNYSSALFEGYNLVKQ